jgi:aspartyl-tRNA(Asn)/glutamyl-tRNA(Gln) amidotransferase subunit B
VEQCTKRFDANANKTIVIRSKEDSHDYKYFPEPDMLRLRTTDAQVEAIRASLPELPDARRARFERDYTITAYDAGVLCADKAVSDWFDEAAQACADTKSLANWMLTEVLREVKEYAGGLLDLKVKPAQLAEMVNLIAKGTISGKIGKTVIAEMFASGKDPGQIVQEKGLVQIVDTGAIEARVREVVDANPAQWAEFTGGKVALKGFFVGQIMKKSGGKANPGMVNQILEKL